MREREFEPGDGAAFVSVWRQILPPDKENYDWLPELLDTGYAQGLFRGALVFDPGHRIAAIGLSCFISAEAVESHHAKPDPYWGISLLEQLRRGHKGAVLGLEAQAAGNLSEGLDLLILEGAGNPSLGTAIAQFDVANCLVTEYLRLHRGYNIRRHLHETEIRFADLQIAGGNRRLYELARQHPHSMSDTGFGPRAIFGMSRELISPENITGHAHQVMNYAPPRLRFRPAEQKVIDLATRGRNDQEIAAGMTISRDRVRQHWSSIYAQVETFAPEVLAPFRPSSLQPRRGPEKRRLVMAYCASRPAELRPHYIK